MRFKCPPGITGDRVEEYKDTLEGLRYALRRSEGTLVDALDVQKGKLAGQVGRGKWLRVPDFVGSDAAGGVSKAMVGGHPWRAVPYAKYLVRLLFDENPAWEMLLEFNSRSDE